jgi:hypothetical protein
MLNQTVVWLLPVQETEGSIVFGSLGWMDYISALAASVTHEVSFAFFFYRGSRVLKKFFIWQ